MALFMESDAHFNVILLKLYLFYCFIIAANKQRLFVTQKQCSRATDQTTQMNKITLLIILSEYVTCTPLYVIRMKIHKKKLICNGEKVTATLMNIPCIYLRMRQLQCILFTNAVITNLFFISVYHHKLFVH
jgi:hypothetical protein